MTKEQRAAYMRKYRTPYMRGFQKAEYERTRQLKQAVRKGDLGLAQTILGAKRTTIFSQSWKDLVKQTGISMGTVRDSKTKKTKRKR